MLAFRHIYQCKDKHTVLIQILKGSLNRILCKMSYLAQLGFIDMCLPNTAFKNGKTYTILISITIIIIIMNKHKKGKESLPVFLSPVATSAK